MVLMNNYDHAIQIAIVEILLNKICFFSYLHSHRIVTEHDKARQGRANTEYITAQNSLTYCSAARDAADKERSSHTPDHPV